MYSYGPLHMPKQKQDDRLEHTYSSYVRIRDVALKTCQRQWTIGRSGERGSGISVLAAQHDDNDDDYCSNSFFEKIYSIFSLCMASNILMKLQTKMLPLDFCINSFNNLLYSWNVRSCRLILWKTFRIFPFIYLFTVFCLYMA